MRISYTRDNTYKFLWWFGVFVFVVSNVYFGWNEKAQSGAEKVCDFIWQFGIIFGGIGLLIQDIVEDYIKSLKINK